VRLYFHQNCHFFSTNFLIISRFARKDEGRGAGGACWVQEWCYDLRAFQMETLRLVVVYAFEVESKEKELQEWQADMASGTSLPADTRRTGPDGLLQFQIVPELNL
jgi:hypothetical protein